MQITTSGLPDSTAGKSYSATLAASGGQPPYRWSISLGSLPSGLLLNEGTGLISGSTLQTGTFSFTAQALDSSSTKVGQALSLTVVAAQSGGNFDGPAELPRVYIQSAIADTPAPGTTVLVNAGGDFQSALNSANWGTTTNPLAGPPSAGPFPLPAKSCDNKNWSTTRPAPPARTWPEEGVPSPPCSGGGAAPPGRPPLNCASTARV